MHLDNPELNINKDKFTCKFLSIAALRVNYFGKFHVLTNLETFRKCLEIFMPECSKTKLIVFNLGVARTPKLIGVII